jgi:hypothetical protein
MRIKMRNSLIVMIACCFLAGAAYAGESLEADIKYLRTIESVYGSAVGVGGGPGDFYEFSTYLLLKGSKVSHFFKV